jgi:signal peptidase I
MTEAADAAVPAAAHEAAPARTRLVRRITGSIWFNVLAAFVVLALVQGFVVKLYYVPSGSMENTLAIGDRVVVDRIGNLLHDPADGDIIVFTASETWGDVPAAPSNPVVYAVKWLGGIVGIGPNLSHTLIKRVIAGPGETVSCCGADGRVMVDGRPLDEPYIHDDLPFVPGVLDCSTVPQSRRCFDAVTVPPGQYVVLGDHRSNSNDSIFVCRGAPASPGCLKTVTRTDIVGRAFAIVLPPGRWGRL